MFDPRGGFRLGACATEDAHAIIDAIIDDIIDAMIDAITDDCVSRIEV
jgi:hypothetical protein